MSRAELEFTLFCIEYMALDHGYTGAEMYDILARKTDVLDTFIIPGYDVLHTQGKDWVEENILDALHEKGVKL